MTYIKRKRKRNAAMRFLKSAPYKTRYQRKMEYVVALMVCTLLWIGGWCVLWLMFQLSILH
jgi:hypothetical protein